MGIRLKSISALAVAAILTTGVASAAGPFGEFGGEWRGVGRVTDNQGKSERLTCKSSDTPSQDGIAMNLSLVCASDSYKVDFHSDLYTDGQNLRGQWTETTRGASGDIHGTITPTLINVTASAGSFVANIAIRATGGKRLDVDLNAKGTSISHVEVTMKR